MLVTTKKFNTELGKIATNWAEYLRYNVVVDENVKEIYLAVQTLESSERDIMCLISDLKKRDEELRTLIKEVVTDLENYKEENNNRIKKLNVSFDERKALITEDVDLKIGGLARYLNNRLMEVGDKAVVPGLLKRIAVLEGYADAVEHRRSTQEILDKLKEVSDKQLEFDRKSPTDEKVEDPVLRAIEDTLRYCLGE